jgi:hypothetical protein
MMGNSLREGGVLRLIGLDLQILFDSLRHIASGLKQYSEGGKRKCLWAFCPRAPSG